MRNLINNVLTNFFYPSQKGSWVRSCPLTDYIDRYFNIRSYADFVYRCETDLGITDVDCRSYASYVEFRKRCLRVKQLGLTLLNVSREGMLLETLFSQLPPSYSDFKHAIYLPLTGQLIASNGDFFVDHSTMLERALIEPDRYSMRVSNKGIELPMEAIVVDNELKPLNIVTEEDEAAFLATTPIKAHYDFKESELAELGMSTSYIWQLMSGRMIANIKQAVKLERVTKGVLNRKLLREDWAEIWPELL